MADNIEVVENSLDSFKLFSMSSTIELKKQIAVRSGPLICLMFIFFQNRSVSLQEVLPCGVISVSTYIKSRF